MLNNEWSQCVYWYGYVRKENVLFKDVLNRFYLRLYGVSWKEGNVLFNDALDTFHLRLYGVRSLSERGNMIYSF